MRGSFVALLGTLLLAAACAEIGVPPGGPVDKTPPRLVGYQPDSLLTSTPADMPLRFSFSEKLDRRSFASALQIVPTVAISDPRFDGRSVEVRPVEEWPDDDVIFWTLLPSLKDDHGVAMERARTGAFSRRDSLPEGAVRLTPTLADLEDWQEGNIVQAILELPPEPDARRATVWRTTTSTSLAPLELGLLDIPSGPFNLRVFVDKNGNGRRDEREAVAELDSLFLPGPETILELGSLILVDLEAPVLLRICAPVSADSTIVQIFVEGLDLDATVRSQPADSTGCAAEFSLIPGLYRAGAWRDEMQDGRFGPDSSAMSEPYLQTIEFELKPATPDSLSLEGPFESLSWDAVDTLRTPPVPFKLHWGAQP